MKTTSQRAESASSCLVCGTVLVGPLGVAARLGGVRRSPQNPNFCNRCDAHIEDGRIVELAVFFADLTGYTTLTHALGPEATHDLLDRYLRMATDVITKWGGFVTQFVGDEVMAFFNVPLQSADYASRAVSAATELQARMKELSDRFERELQATVGIASGHARVGQVGSEEIRHYGAIGDVVNRAARLVSRVEAGGVLVDGAMYRSVADQFPDAEREQVPLKGFDEPVEVALLRGRRSLDVAPPSEGSTGRYVRYATALAAVLGAPCAGIVALGPVGAALGIGSFGIAAALPFLDQAGVRIPLLTVATLGAAANLAVLSGVGIKRDTDVAAAALEPTRAERRRTRFGIVLSLATLGAVGFELIAHQIMH